MPIINLEYLAAGGNRHPSAADWAPGLLAFGAGNNVALWNPDDESQRGIFALLAGHTDVVNAVKIYDTPDRRRIITGGADNTIRIWTQSAGNGVYEQSQCLNEHSGSVNTISILNQHGLFATGSADGTLKIWQFSDVEVKLLQSIQLKPHYLPLASSMVGLDNGSIVIALAGTSNYIQLYVRTKINSKFALQATLIGHEGWIRSLDFTREASTEDSDVILASASQDKYIRLWRFHKNSNGFFQTSNCSVDHSLSMKKSLSNKAQQVGSAEVKHNVTFEALLIGHEDWIYNTRWAPRVNETSSLKLLSASADNSLSIWSPDQSSGVWICETRLGEISAQKGSTTATGSAGGFWMGLWHPTGSGVVSLGRNGSWRRWNYDLAIDGWLQVPGISGHTQEVRSLAWAPDGSYLLTTSSDQTTRFFAEWKRNGTQSWHEFARPQIHGYDLNCIDSINQQQFISGADEKLLRVFNKPKAIARLLEELCEIRNERLDDLPDAANIPVLGLSNKAIVSAADEEPKTNGTTPHDLDENGTSEGDSMVPRTTLESDHPPFEDHLSRQTLWPEHEKLYGHGYEISAVAASHDGSLVATACKATSLEHAVIRIYECREWREVKPALASHTLTATSLTFSPDDKYLLSVGRDRQWAIFARADDNSNNFKLLTANPKGHARMILDCSWAPSAAGYVFATASRDKTVKVWKLMPSGIADYVASVTDNAPVTAVAFLHTLNQETLRLALGTETATVRIVDLDHEDYGIVQTSDIPRELLPSSAVNTLSWRPGAAGRDARPEQLAIASDDTSLRILNISP